jgi:hypothetical protein
LKALTPPELEGWRPKSRGYESPQHNWRYGELDAAITWGLTPWQFDELNVEEKSEMIAYTWVQRMSESYCYEKAENAAQKSAPPPSQMTKPTRSK